MSTPADLLTARADSYAEDARKLRTRALIDNNRVWAAAYQAIADELYAAANALKEAAA